MAGNNKFSSMQENTRKSKVYMCKSKVKQRPAIRGCEKGGLNQGLVGGFFVCLSILSAFFVLSFFVVFVPVFLVFFLAWPADGRFSIELAMKLAIAAFRYFSCFLVFVSFILDVSCCLSFFSRFLFLTFLVFCKSPARV